MNRENFKPGTQVVPALLSKVNENTPVGRVMARRSGYIGKQYCPVLLVVKWFRKDGTHWDWDCLMENVVPR